MDTTRFLQYLRIPVLVALLAAATVPEPQLFRAFTRLQLDAAVGPWLPIVASGLAFVAVSLWGRLRRHPPAVLAVEGVLAGVVGLVPPMAWIQWFGVGGFGPIPGVATDSMFVHALGLAWLGVVIATAIRQVRDGRSRTSTDSPQADGAATRP